MALEADWGTTMVLQGSEVDEGGDGLDLVALLLEPVGRPRFGVLARGMAVLREGGDVRACVCEGEFVEEDGDGRFLS